ncbi:MAG: hypothetical protein PWQ74_985 [Methanobacteriaceae archaeon]|nr:hypothetical protein [Methanobacteriaceae archaeon]
MLVVGGVVGGYAAYYAHAMTTLVPKDLKTFKDDLKEMEELKSMDLKMIPAKERKQAEELRSSVSLKEFQELKYNCTRNREDVASRYDLLLMEDVARDIRKIYSKDIEKKQKN